MGKGKREAGFEKVFQCLLAEDDIYIFQCLSAEDDI